MLIDEAQYIKNQKAAMTKSVKGIKSGFLLALTGTPIENFLEELWSIFKFLMPGFLYDYATFSERFETPSVRRMLLFSQFTSMLELLERDLQARRIAYYKITGNSKRKGKSLYTLSTEELLELLEN